MRLIEDFEGMPSAKADRADRDDTEPSGVRLRSTDEELPQVFPGRKDTKEELAPIGVGESQPISVESPIAPPLKRPIKAVGRKPRRWLPFVAASACAALAFFLLGAWKW